jgi:hypothetical protein
MLRSLLIILSISVIFFAGCKSSGSKYSDLKILLQDVIKANEEYVGTLEKATTAKDVAEAINKLGGLVEKYAARADEIEKRHPELKDIDKKNPPSELKDEYDKLNQLEERRVKVSIKMMVYMKDPEVLKAIQDLVKKTAKTRLIK